jgi:hypothetical protein
VQVQGLLLDAGRRRPLLHVDLPMPPRRPRHDYLFNSSPLSVSSLLCAILIVLHIIINHTLTLLFFKFIGLLAIG